MAQHRAGQRPRVLFGPTAATATAGGADPTGAPATSAATAAAKPAATAGHAPVLVSLEELRVLSVKKLLDARGLSCELHGAGAKQRLAVRTGPGAAGMEAEAGASASVVVRPGACRGRLVLEGPLCAAYFAVRQAIYDSLTLV